MNMLTSAMFGLEALGEAVVVGVDPGMGRVRADELEAERAQPSPAGVGDRLQLRAGHPQWRVRLLARLGQHVAEREVVVGAVVLGASVGEHRDDAAQTVLPPGALVLEVDAERVELGDARALAGAELDPTVAEQVERRDAGGHLGRVAGGQLDDAVAEPDVARTLAGRAQEHLRRR
jgi:hypothetical protein